MRYVDELPFGMRTVSRPAMDRGPAQNERGWRHRLRHMTAAGRGLGRARLRAASFASCSPSPNPGFAWTTTRWIW